MSKAIGEYAHDHSQLPQSSRLWSWCREGAEKNEGYGKCKPKYHEKLMKAGVGNKKHPNNTYIKPTITRTKTMGIWDLEKVNSCFYI